MTMVKARDRASGGNERMGRRAVCWELGKGMAMGEVGNDGVCA
jgi:hypothetical protein